MLAVHPMKTWTGLLYLYFSKYSYLPCRKFMKQASENTTSWKSEHTCPIDSTLCRGPYYFFWTNESCILLFIFLPWLPNCLSSNYGKVISKDRHSLSSLDLMNINYKLSLNELILPFSIDTHSKARQFLLQTAWFFLPYLVLGNLLLKNFAALA